MNKISLLGFVFMISTIVGCSHLSSIFSAGTTKEKDLSKIAVVGSYESNLYAKDLNIKSTKYLTNWETGKNRVAVQLFKPDGSGYIELEGAVLINGDTAKYESNGLYSRIYDKTDLSIKKIDLISDGGQSLQFKIAASPTFKIKSINGKTSDYTIDITKRLVLEFDLPEEAKGKKMVVSLISNVSGGREFNKFQPFLATEKVVVPAGSFKSKQWSKTDKLGNEEIQFAKGKQWIQVELLQEDRLESDPHPYLKRRSSHLETVPVEVTGTILANSFYKISGSVYAQGQGKPFEYSGLASQGYYGASLEAKKLRIGIASVGASAILKEYLSSDTYNKKATATTETIVNDLYDFTFPTISEVYWNQYLKGIYDGFKAILDKYQVEIVDIDQVIADPNYGNIKTFPESKDIKELYRFNYKNSTRMTGMQPISISQNESTNLLGDETVKAKLLTSLSLDAIASINMYFRMDGERYNVLVSPTANLLIEGRNVLDRSTVSSWYSIEVRGEQGAPFNEKDFRGVEGLNRILQKDPLLHAFESAIRDLVVRLRSENAAEKWNLANE